MNESNKRQPDGRARFRTDFSDQKAIFDPTKFGHRITCIGAGGIGASAAAVLGTLGPSEIEYWDSDIVEPTNLASTLLFGPDDVLHPKVDAVQRELNRLGVPSVTTHRKMFDPVLHRDQLGSIVISGLDTMAARRTLWEGALAWNPNIALYLDGRTGGETFQLNVVRPNNPDDIEWYQGFQLFDDDRAASLPCAERNIVYAATALGAVMASRLANFSRGLPTGRMISMNMQTLQSSVV